MIIQIAIFGILSILALYGLLKLEKISKKSLMILLTFIILFASIFYFIERENKIYQNNVVRLNLEFTQGKEIMCQEISVNNEKFNISSNSFIAKRNSNLIGTIIPFTNCFQ